MSAPTTEVQQQTEDARGQVAPVPYSVLAPGRGVEWQELGDGIVIRVPPRRGLKKSEWCDIACFAVFWAIQLFAHPSVTFVVSFTVLLLAVVAWKIFLAFFAPAHLRRDFNPQEVLKDRKSV